MKDSPHIPTLRDIARAAGVSPMTVSRALSGGQPRVGSNRERVRQLAESMGWKPNPLVSALMSQRVRQAGPRATANLAIFDPRCDEPAANGEYLRGCLERAQQMGYQTEVIPYRIGETNAERLRDILQARGIRGIVVLPLPVATHTLDFDFTGFSAVAIGYSLLEPALPRIANDTRGNVHTALRHFEERGYRKVGLIMSDDANRRMFCEYSAAAYSYDRFFSTQLTVKQLILPDEDFSPQCIKSILDWIKKQRLEGVLSSAQHLYDRLIESGASIPGQTAFIHLHRAPGDLTCIDQLRQYSGHKATDLVTSMIQRNEHHPMQYAQITLTPSVLIPGNTVPRRDASAIKNKVNFAKAAAAATK